MHHPAILALGSSEAAMLLRSPRGAQVEAILSIYGRREFPLDCPDVPRRLVLQFDDADVADPSDALDVLACRARAKAAAENGWPLTPPMIEDARRIVAFARGVADVKGVVICQCQAGVSRSTAAALLCLATWTGEGLERCCAEELLRVRPCATPHRGLVAFGDEVLGRGGRLIEALRTLRLRA